MEYIIAQVRTLWPLISYLNVFNRMLIGNGSNFVIIIACLLLTVGVAQQKDNTSLILHKAFGSVTKFLVNRLQNIGIAN